MGRIMTRLNRMFKKREAKGSEPGQKPLDQDTKKLLEEIEEAMGHSKDLVIRQFTIGCEPPVLAAAVYIDGMADPDTVHSFIIKSLMLDTHDTKLPQTMIADNIFALIKDRAFTLADIKDVTTMEDLLAGILAGNTVLLLQGMPKGLSASTYGAEGRKVEQPQIQTVIRGPREAFTETMQINTVLIRRRIRDAHLWLESQKIGRVTQTEVAIMYIKGIAQEKIIQEVRDRLKRIDTDGILESGQIEGFIQDQGWTPFATVYNTERPDVVAASLLEGRVAILVDGTPFVLLVPTGFIQFFQAPDDYYQRFGFATRLLRYFAFLVSLTTPALYIAVTTFHQDMIPTVLLISLAAQREGIPFPGFFEALLMEVTFEILREAGIRLPRPIGSAVSIVGALVLGQAAVQASLVSPAMVMVVSLTAIANFVSPSVSLSDVARYLRFGLMILAAAFGFFGIIFGLIMLVIHLCSLRSFGYPYMAPVAPLILKDYKDVIPVATPQMDTRPQFISQGNQVRTKRNQPKTSR